MPISAQTRPVIARVSTTGSASHPVVFALAGSAGVMLATGAQAAAPQPWQLNLQPPAGSIAEMATDLHNLLLVVITAISLFVLALLIHIYAARLNDEEMVSIFTFFGQNFSFCHFLPVAKGKEFVERARGQSSEEFGLSQNAR